MSALKVVSPNCHHWSSSSWQEYPLRLSAICSECTCATSTHRARPELCTSSGCLGEGRSSRRQPGLPCRVAGHEVHGAHARRTGSAAPGQATAAHLAPAVPLAQDRPRGPLAPSAGRSRCWLCTHCISSGLRAGPSGDGAGGGGAGHGRGRCTRSRWTRLVCLQACSLMVAPRTAAPHNS